MRTYGSKPRKVSASIHLWDGSRDVPHCQPLDETTVDNNERKTTTTTTVGIGGFVKGVVGWLSPRKSSRSTTTTRKVSRKENKLSKQSARFSLSDDDDNVKDVSITSTADTLIASTPIKEEKLIPELKKGIDLLLQFCSEEEVVPFPEYINGILENAEIRKLGEATFSEVFTLEHSDGTKKVLKIVPFFENNERKDNSMSNLEDIIQEVRISRAMAKIEGFADFHGYTSPTSELTLVQR
jgi:hypothetical protein